MICRFHKLKLITRDKYLSNPWFQEARYVRRCKVQDEGSILFRPNVSIKKGLGCSQSAVMKQWFVTLLFMWLVLGRPTGICCPTRHIKPSISTFRWNFRSGTESALNQTVSFRLASLKRSSAERTVKFCHCLK